MPAAVWQPWAALMLLMALIALGGEPARRALSLTGTAIADGQWWRWLTAHLVHLGSYHLVLNEAAVAVLVLLCPEPLRWRAALRRLLWLALAVSAGMVFLQPQLLPYVGLSGVLHGLFVLGLWSQRRDNARVAWIGLALLFGKVGYEQLAGSALTDAAVLGGTVATAAHLYGTLAALAYAVVWRSDGRSEPFRWQCSRWTRKSKNDSQNEQE